MTAPRGQNGVMLAALRQRPQSALALNRLGIGRPNSRAAELRRRGYEIVCSRVPGKSGAASFVYRLAGPLEDAPSRATSGEVRTCSGQAGASSSGSVSSTLGRSIGGLIGDGGVGMPPAVLAVSPAVQASEPGPPVQLSLEAVA